MILFFAWFFAITGIVCCVSGLWLIGILCLIISLNLLRRYEKKQRILKDMERNALLEQKESLLAELSALDQKLAELQSADPLYIRKEQLEEEIESLDEQLEETEQELTDAFALYLVEQGYTQDANSWCTSYSQLFDGYAVIIDLDEINVQVTDGTEDGEAVFDEYYDDYEQVKEALASLVVQKKVATITLEYPFLVVNGEGDLTSDDVLETLSDVVYYTNDLSDYITNTTVQ